MSNIGFGLDKANEYIDNATDKERALMFKEYFDVTGWAPFVIWVYKDRLKKLEE